LLGEAGLTKLAEINHAKASILADRLAGISGIEILNTYFFNEFTLRLHKPALEVVDDLAKRRILAGVPVSRLLPDDKNSENLLLIAVTEMVTDKDMDLLINALKEVL